MSSVAPSSERFARFFSATSTENAIDDDHSDMSSEEEARPVTPVSDEDLSSEEEQDSYGDRFDERIDAVIADVDRLRDQIAFVKEQCRRWNEERALEAAAAEFEDDEEENKENL